MKICRQRFAIQTFQSQKKTDNEIPDIWQNSKTNEIFEKLEKQKFLAIQSSLKLSY